MRKAKILVLDNYDSFTYNLVHLLKELTKNPVEVFRNDRISLKEVDAYDKIVLSPGPGVPEEANILKPLIERYAPSKSLFGVCLGQQAIAEVFGGELLNTQKVYHGVSSKIKIIDTKEKIFRDLPESIEVGRYHSWVVSKESFPKELIITAKGPEGEIMALRHKSYDVTGVQFHPESILTPQGKKIMHNWLNI
ncbi:anthranilate synthase component II [Bacteroidetes bacterium endosymbiont of Geopemphigus sp.]|uniref:anthranilate synthase component II n=1 Tax=Bacteroidetes bacterium endosymbiont of Geopemphigus sp. TaxID=2047937 RepID=UPI000CD17B31|nr:aminodeoxychorismate/anthranilate synthase component II [Bacteroidetes bacterium endosymbiont of Geopemphigus sp.]